MLTLRSAAVRQGLSLGFRNDGPAAGAQERAEIARSRSARFVLIFGAGISRHRQPPPGSRQQVAAARVGGRMPTTLTIVPWPDPVIDTIGHDPRSLYAETFWLPTLGPTALLLLRHLATRFDQQPGGLQLRVAETSQALGVGNREGSSSPILRTLARLEQFEIACADPLSPTIAVRRNLPPVNRRQLGRMPLPIQRQHARLAEARLEEPRHVEARHRARRLALVLHEQGDTDDEVERALASIGFHPAICHEATRWAHARQREAASTTELAV